MKKVSFDFDDTLSFESVQEYAKKLIAEGVEVHIVTSRWEDPVRYSFIANHDDLFGVAEKLGIPKEHIHFTNMEYKWRFFMNNPVFIWHLDDNDEELQLFHEHKLNTRCLWALSGEYDYVGNELLGLTHLNE